jgi:hypothetical protein
MSALLSLLFSRAGLVAMGGIALLILFGVQEGRLKLAQHGQASASAALHEAEAAEAQRDHVSAQISADAQASHAEDQVRIRTVTRTLIQKVPSYVPAAADADCVVSRGFVQLHDAAAQGLPAPAGGPDPAPSGVPLSAVAETVVANYGVAYDWRAEALTWRDWYVKQAQAWSK